MNMLHLGGGECAYSLGHFPFNISLLQSNLQGVTVLRFYNEHKSEQVTTDNFERRRMSSHGVKIHELNNCLFLHVSDRLCFYGLVSSREAKLLNIHMYAYQCALISHTEHTHKNRHFGSLTLFL